MFRQFDVDPAQGPTGVWTFSLEDGEVWDSGELIGQYTIDGDLWTVTWIPDDIVTVYRWEQDNNGDLHLSVVEADDEWLAFETMFTSNPWARVGDVD
jgi:hypothetical protein